MGSTMTFIGGAAPILYAGGESVVFPDIEPISFC